MTNNWKLFLVRKTAIPWILFFVVCCMMFIVNIFYRKFQQQFGESWHTIYNVIISFLKIALILIVLWITWIFLTIVQKYLHSKIVNTKKKFLELVYPLLSNILRVSIMLIMANVLISEIEMVQMPKIFLEKFSISLLIFVLWYGFYQLINILEKLILFQYMEENKYTISYRKINTQVIILKRVILTIGTLVFISATLLLFEGVRNIGTGLLTTAGIISAVGAFASQKSLTRLLSGLQIALTQPVKIGDTVIIDNEFGEVEEISLSYVVIKIWDLRRLILPTDYLLTKGIQNLSRTSTQLLGTVFFYMDHTISVELVREYFNNIINQSLYWDKKVKGFQVTDFKEFTMEIRALMSAENAADLWNLRCEIREKVISYIVNNNPDFLPKIRVLID